jgi:hypothetical protein
MHVPVLLTRQVLVNGVAAVRFVLSGMVTSATNAALLVQLGSLAGCVDSAVTVGVGDAASVTTLSVTAGVSVTADCVSVGDEVWVNVAVAVAGSVAACGAQLETIRVANNVTTNNLLIILNSFALMLNLDSTADQI